MKKFTLFLAIILFSGFILIGFKLAERVFPLHLSSQSEINPPSTEPEEQRNYLIIHVNDLQIKNPQLIAIWVILKSISSSEELFFISLYPTTNLGTNEQIKSIFSITRENHLTASSYRRFKRIFNLVLDGYFIVDNSGLLSLASSSNVEQLELVNDSPQSPDSVKIVQKNGKVFLSRICDLMSSGAGNSFFSQLDWAMIMPAHFTSSMSFEDIQTLIEEENLSLKNLICKIVISE